MPSSTVARQLFISCSYATRTRGLQVAAGGEEKGGGSTTQVLKGHGAEETHLVFPCSPLATSL